MAEDEQSIGRGSEKVGDLPRTPDGKYLIGNGPFYLAVDDPALVRQWAVATLVDRLGLPSYFALIGTGRIRSQRSEETPLANQEQTAQISSPTDIPPGT